MDASKVKDPIPADFETIEAAAEFWDTHSVADYWDEFQEVEIEVTAPRRRRVSVEPEIWQKVAEVAHRKGVTVETLVNLWLAERVAA
jgi:sugar/nucleoside kinase (ribokinase family)